MSVFALKNKLIPVLTLSAMTVVITLVFQNCGNARFGQDSSDANSLNSLQNCTDPNCTDIINGNGSCSFNGQTITHGTSITAFLNSSGATCTSEIRTCDNGVLSGSYAYASCSVSTPNSCLFNGQTIAHGASITAYLASSPGAGQSCQSEVRTCNNGALSGSYLFANCTSTQANSCLFNGSTVQSGSGVFAYKTSSVPAGEVCQVEFRLCANGQLSGSNTFASCSPAAPASCMFNGQTVASGSAVIGYQNSTVAAGKDCVSEARVCNNGTLSGSFNYGSCVPEAPAACLFDGLTVPSGGAVIAYLASSVGPGESCQMQARSCVNGQLSGSYPFSSCITQQAAACQFNGQTVAHGDSRTAYEKSSVPAGDSCKQQTRTCNNGTMSGSYTFATCTPEAPASCKFNDRDVASGEVVIAYKKKTVEAGESCEAENRKCTNGVLSGTFVNASCTAAELRSCTFNGQTLKSGSAVTAYKSATVPFGQSCTEIQEARTCVDGTLSGSYTFPTCSVEAGASCKFNDKTVAHGASVTAYTANSVPYGKSCEQVKETRTCTNGKLSGSGTFEACSTAAGRSCDYKGKVVAHGKSIFAYTAALVEYGKSCDSVKQERVCTDGTLSGTATIDSCSVKPGAACTLDGKSFPSGSTVDAYSSKLVEFGASCSSVKQSRTCTNGSWSGSANYAYLSCAPKAAVDCKLGDGTVVKHGATHMSYKAKNVVFGQTCSGVNRTCSNGSFTSGAGYEYGSCSVNAARSCTLEGKTYAHGATVTSYLVKYAPWGKACSSYQVNNKCVDGSWTSPGAAYGSCLPKFRWINVKYGTKQDCTYGSGGQNNSFNQRCWLTYQTPTHAAACAGAGMVPAADQGDGVCASGEKRPSSAGGTIEYWLSTWGGDLRGGTVVNTSVGLECYGNGQKQDHDKTDKIVAYLCSY